MTADRITSLDDLVARYGEPVESSIRKVTTRIRPTHARYIDASPFLVLATVGPEGVDCSPRGDPAGFVRIVDDRTLRMPDRRGNNRLDSLRNIVRDPRVALLFLVPGIGVTLRVNGRAWLRTDAELRESFRHEDKVPATIIEVEVLEVYTQCPKALIRSSLWDPASYRTADELPTVGDIMSEITDGAFDGAAHDASYPELIRTTMY